jgi:hypothetical protein
MYQPAEDHFHHFHHYSFPSQAAFVDQANEAMENAGTPLND